MPTQQMLTVETSRAMPDWLRILASDLCWNEVETARLRPMARSSFDAYVEARAAEMRLLDESGKAEREAEWQRSPAARQIASDLRRLLANATERARRALERMRELEELLRRKEAFSAELLSRVPPGHQAAVILELRECISKALLPALPGSPTPSAAPGRPAGVVQPPPFWLVPGPAPIERVATLAPGGPGPGAGAWAVRVPRAYPLVAGTADRSVIPQPSGLGQAKDVDPKVAAAEKERDQADSKLNKAKCELKYWRELYAKEPKNDRYKDSVATYVKLVDAWTAELARLVKLVNDLKKRAVIRQPTYTYRRISTLPFGPFFPGT